MGTPAALVSGVVAACLPRVGSVVAVLLFVSCAVSVLTGPARIVVRHVALRVDSIFSRSR